MTANELSFTGPSGSREPDLNPRYTLSEFIVDSGNRMAHAASVAVAEKPGALYNPLFLYGGTGIGKTHLLQAIGHYAAEGGLAVRYVSAEAFATEALHAVRTHTSEELRARYGSVDVLLVDDIHFIAGKESTEEAFFHIFNSLYENKKQIVMSSDRAPKAMVTLQDRLRSRFEWGLIADIQPAPQELRKAILREKLDAMHREMPNEVMEFVAQRAYPNSHKLEESLNRVLSYAEEHHVLLTVEVARLALQDELNERYDVE